MAGPILIIGATGTVGSELVAQLRGKGESVCGATRKPAEAARRSSPADEYVEFDLERPETFVQALQGIDRVFLMARPGDDHADRVALPLIDEMKRQGVRHVVDLSAIGVEKREEMALRKVEQYLERSGMEFTHLRPNWFMQVFTGGPLLAGIRAAAAIQIPAADARISYVDVRDIVAMAAAALTEPGHAGKAYTITGPQALHHQEIAEQISGATGKAVRYVPISEETARKALQSAGFPPERVERLIGFYQFVRAGFCEPVSPDTETVLGRQPISFERFANDYASSWR
ncbi:MAG: SDR family oxidoreductase [Thermoguttaceae bacterium]|jgi:uncharacterized protein YbjT (DUF2867 family)